MRKAILIDAGIHAGYYKAALSGAESIEESDAGYVKKIAGILAVTYGKAAFVAGVCRDDRNKDRDKADYQCDPLEKLVKLQFIFFGFCDFGLFHGYISLIRADTVI